jgi:hypothetical protein
MKRMAGTGKQCLINCNYTYITLTGFAVLTEGHDVFRLRAAATDGRRIRQDNLSFSRTLVRLACESLTQKRLGSYYLNASETVDGGRQSLWQ